MTGWKKYGAPSFYLKFLSTITILTFCFNTILSPVSIAYSSVNRKNIEYRPGTTVARRTAPLQENPIVIPSSMGSIQEIYFPPLPYDSNAHPPLIIHIQDAHTSLEAQENIRNILHHLVQTYDIHSLFLEGTMNNVVPEAFQFFDDFALNQKMAMLLAKDGVIGGAELFLADQLVGEHGRDISAYGPENAKLYQQNLEVFQYVLHQENESNEFLNFLQSLILTNASYTLNETLLTLFQRWIAFNNHELSLLDYLNFLGSHAERELGLNLSDARNQLQWPMLTRILKMRELEQKIVGQEQKAAVEYDTLLNWAREQNIPAELIHKLKSVLDKKGASEKSNQNLRNFFHRLYGTLNAKDFTFSNYPNALLKSGISILQDELEANQLFQEIERLSYRLLNHCATTRDEKQLITIQQNAFLLKTLLSLNLTPDDYSRINVRKNDLLPSVLLEQLSKINNQRSVVRKPKSVKVPSGQKVLATDRIFNCALDFYTGAKKREEAIFANTISKMKTVNETTAVLITGGFHADGFLEQCKKQNIAFIEIAPHISETTTDIPYRDVMQFRSNALALRSQVKAFPIHALPAAEQAFIQNTFTQELTRSELRILNANLATVIAQEISAIPSGIRKSALSQFLFSVNKSRGAQILGIRYSQKRVLLYQGNPVPANRDESRAIGLTVNGPTTYPMNKIARSEIRNGAREAFGEALTDFGLGMYSYLLSRKQMALRGSPQEYYREAALFFAEMKFFDQALIFAEKIPEPTRNQKIRTFLKIAKNALEDGNIPAAKKAWAHAQNSFQGFDIARHIDVQHALKTKAIVEAELGLPTDNTIRLLSEHMPHSVTFAKLMVQIVQANDLVSLDKLRSDVFDLTDEEQQIDALKRILEREMKLVKSDSDFAYVRKTILDAVTNLLQSNPSKNPTWATLASLSPRKNQLPRLRTFLVAVKFLAKDKSTEARGIANRFLYELETRIKNGPAVNGDEQAEMLAGIAKLKNELGEPGSDKLFRRSKEIALLIEDAKTRSLSLSRIAELESDSGRHKDAEETLKLLPPFLKHFRLSAMKAVSLSKWNSFKSTHKMINPEADFPEFNALTEIKDPIYTLELLLLFMQHPKLVKSSIELRDAVTIFQNSQDLPLSITAWADAQQKKKISVESYELWMQSIAEVAFQFYAMDSSDRWRSTLEHFHRDGKYQERFLAQAYLRAIAHHNALLDRIIFHAQGPDGKYLTVVTRWGAMVDTVPEEEWDGMRANDLFSQGSETANALMNERQIPAIVLIEGKPISNNPFDMREGFLAWREFQEPLLLLPRERPPTTINERQVRLIGFSPELDQLYYAIDGEIISCHLDLTRFIINIRTWFENKGKLLRDQTEEKIKYLLSLPEFESSGKHLIITGAKEYSLSPQLLERLLSPQEGLSWLLEANENAHRERGISLNPAEIYREIFLLFTFTKFVEQGLFMEAVVYNALYHGPIELKGHQHAIETTIDLIEKGIATPLRAEARIDRNAIDDFSRDLDLLEKSSTSVEDRRKAAKALSQTMGSVIGFLTKNDQKSVRTIMNRLAAVYRRETDHEVKALLAKDVVRGQFRYKDEETEGFRTWYLEYFGAYANQPDPARSEEMKNGLIGLKEGLERHYEKLKQKKKELLPQALRNAYRQILLNLVKLGWLTQSDGTRAKTVFDLLVAFLGYSYETPQTLTSRATPFFAIDKSFFTQSGTIRQLHHIGRSTNHPLAQLAGQLLRNIKRPDERRRGNTRSELRIAQELTDGVFSPKFAQQLDQEKLNGLLAKILPAKYSRTKPKPENYYSYLSRTPEKTKRAQDAILSIAPVFRSIPSASDPGIQSLIDFASHNKNAVIQIYFPGISPPLLNDLKQTMDREILKRRAELGIKSGGTNLVFTNDGEKHKEFMKNVVMKTAGRLVIFDSNDQELKTLAALAAKMKQKTFSDRFGKTGETLRKMGKVLFTHDDNTPAEIKGYAITAAINTLLEARDEDISDDVQAASDIMTLTQNFEIYTRAQEIIQHAA